jgi:hypothetical protein
MTTFPEFSFSVLVHGSPVREYHHEGKIWVEGRKGTEYTLLFRNHTHEPVLAIFSVDGLSTMDGEVANYETGSGYVVGPRDEIKIPGWRLNNEEIASFRFGSKKSSYAAQTDRPQNVGIVGCAVLKRRVSQGVRIPYTTVTYSSDRLVFEPYTVSTRPIKWIGHTTYDSKTNIESEASYSCQNSVRYVQCSTVSADLGTQFGQRKSHKVTEVTFDRDLSSVQVCEINYASANALRQMGIIGTQVKAAVARAFPNSPSIGCTPPENWEG